LAALEKIQERLATVSDRLSTQTRTLAIGLIAFFWTILTSEAVLAKRFSQTFKSQLLGIVGLAILALLFDFMQYAVGYLYANIVREKAEASSKKEAAYDYAHPLYRIQNLCFWMKQSCVVSGSVWLLVLIFIQLHQS
jgi:hypothetical protein